MNTSTHLQLELCLHERWHVSLLLVGVVQEVLQGAVDAVEEAVQHNVIKILHIVTPDL